MNSTLKAITLSLICLIAVPSLSAQQTLEEDPTINSGVNTQRLWKRAAVIPSELEQSRYIFAESFRTYSIDMAIMNDLVELTTRPTRDTDRKVITLMFIPMPDGSMQQFEIWNAPVMHPDLADRYPEIQTYTGKGISDPSATIKVDKTPQGVHAQILRPSGTVYVDPYAFGNDQYYISYLRSDFRAHPLKVRNELGVPGSEGNSFDIDPGTLMRSDGDEVRTYRLALACTGEYAAFHGGTVSGALGGMATTLNRINGIYEREFSVNMELIADNDLIVFLNSSTDPYTNGNGFAMLGQNQTTVDNIIGSANYDLGHVFSTGGGGVASFGSVCNSSNKAEGVTGGFAPIGDAFDVDYVAHELGHQFRGEHSWNYCGGTGGTGSTDFEPGGGSTIMGYAGICGSDNYAFNSDDYFMGANLVQMTAFIVSGTGSTCGTVNSTSNTPPTITEFPIDYTIPVSTPFELTAAAVDAEGDNLTYCWEQEDGLNNVAIVNSPSGRIGAPLFRSFPPSESGTRVFPSMNLLVTNTTSRVEFMPDYARTLKFKVTVRDNHPGSGATVFENMVLTVDDQGGPFFITEPDGPAVVWEAGNWYPVSWEVGATNSAPFDCETVRILLSEDGGYTYPVTLNESAPNNGSTFIYVPDLPGSNIRIKVACNENVFFQINNGDIKIENTGSISGLSGPVLQPLKLFPNPASDWVQIESGSGLSLHQAQLRITDYTGRTLLSQVLQTSSDPSVAQINIKELVSGMYLVELRHADGQLSSQKLVVE